MITKATVSAKRASFSIRASGRFWVEEGLVGANAKTLEIPDRLLNICFQLVLLINQLMNEKN